jgi:UDP-N-acetylmuramoylalanine--D-glutamate ligase
MTVFILGYGASGKAAALLLLNLGYKNIVVCEKKELDLSISGVTFLSDKEDFLMMPQDKLILSPGISGEHPIVQKAIKSGCEVLGEAELALREIRCRAVAISGTNGKTTTTLLTAHVLRSVGFETYAAGNLGSYGPALSAAACDLKDRRDAILVAELSSYQLETAKARVFDGAALLNITQDHLDRYPSMLAYATAKANLAALLKNSANFFLHKSCLDQFYELFSSIPKQVFGPMVQVASKIHPDNLMAAYKLCSIFSIPVADFLEAAETFIPPRHRCEYVATVAGVSYYDDSKGTTVDAVIHAISQQSKPIILIAGGLDKNSNFSPWIDAFSGRVKLILTIGQAAEKIAQQLRGSIEIVRCETLQHAVKEASRRAIAGDAVLLSPGCASLDMFKDYEERGRLFQECVCSLTS